jgi:hypothetical protein
MRPVDKGDWPKNAGVQVVYTDHKYARGELVWRLGRYCSYCEMYNGPPIDVEHRLPKTVPRYGHLKLEWSNFLLSCTMCNSYKGHSDINENDYFWPDTHNTFFALEYGPGALVSSSRGLSASEKRKADNLIKLIGLDRLPGDPMTVSDSRWSDREQAWGIAEHMRLNLIRNDSIQLRESIALNAKLGGYFSVWMTVFADDSDMLQRIIASYPGTAIGCFDDQGKCRESVNR